MKQTEPAGNRDNRSFQGCLDRIRDQDAEISQLKEDNAQFAWRDQDKNKLIIELADALDKTTQILFVRELPADVVNNKIRENKLLQERSREATQ